VTDPGRGAASGREAGPSDRATGASADAAAAPIDVERLVADLRALVRIPSVTGSEEAVAAWAADALREIGLDVELATPDPATIRADPEWPGEEMPRTALPVVIGRAGVPGARRVILSGHLDVVPPGDPATCTAAGQWT
jgi:acetylornithine deacetylase